MRKISLFFICMIVSTFLANAQTTVYVSPSGTGNGSSSSTPTSLNSALDATIAAGTTIILLDGTYTISGDRYFWVKQGTSSSPITIKAQNKQQAILKGDAVYASNKYAVLNLAGCKHVVIDGLTVMHESTSNDQQAGINI
ncbi:MAG: hypothetical protein ACRCVT_14195, partial [Leadbetterella sp.]